MNRAVLAAVILLGSAPAIAQETATGDQTTVEESSKSTTQTAAIAKAKEPPDFKLPPGFYEKKFGKHLLYCKKDAPMGTRIRTERCMNDGQMRDYLLALQQQKTDIDRTRATCATAAVCASN